MKKSTGTGDGGLSQIDEFESNFGDIPFPLQKKTLMIDIFLRWLLVTRMKKLKKTRIGVFFFVCCQQALSIFKFIFSSSFGGVA